MQYLFNIITQLSPIITIIISSFISYFIAKYNAKNEIRKALLSFAREDRLAMDKAFAELVSGMERLCTFRCDGNIRHVVTANAYFLTLAPKVFHPIIKDIDIAVNKCDLNEIQKLKKDLIEMYSQQK